MGAGVKLTRGCGFAPPGGGPLTRLHSGIFRKSFANLSGTSIAAADPGFTSTPPPNNHEHQH